MLILIINVGIGVAGSLYPIALTELIHSADVIVDASIESKTCFKQDGFIYTDYTLHVVSTLKGEKETFIHLLVEGGTVGEFSIVSSAETKLESGDEGIFMMNKINGNYILHAHAQSVFLYHFETKAYYNPFVEIKKNDLEKLFGKSGITGAQSRSSKPVVSPTGNPLVMSISPLSITAGTESILTIVGSGFGSAQTGKVFFANPDDAGSTYVSALSTKIQTWTDTKITIAVPAQAGSGNVWVQQNGVISKSVQKLDISYARSNAESNNYQFKVTLVNQNQAGGYGLNINHSFLANDSAYQAYSRALQSWRCRTGVNFTIGDSTDITARTNDNVSLVRFANKNELKQGVLGITYSYYSSCSSGYWYLTEFDMLFLDTSLWNFDPMSLPSSKFDFESVVLHEMGHAHQLSHVINPSNIMHYSIAAGSNKRSIDTFSFDCASSIINESKKNGLCGPSAHQTIDSDHCNDISFAYYNFESPSTYPNPSEDILHINFNMPSESLGSIELYDVMGQTTRQLFSQNFAAGRNSYSIDLRNYYLHTGVYLLKIAAFNKTFMKKIIYLKK